MVTVILTEMAVVMGMEEVMVEATETGKGGGSWQR
jgi:hypothetical protein